MVALVKLFKHVLALHENDVRVIEECCRCLTIYAVNRTSLCIFRKPPTVFFSLYGALQSIRVRTTPNRREREGGLRGGPRHVAHEARVRGGRQPDGPRAGRGALAAAEDERLVLHGAVPRALGAVHCRFAFGQL